MGRPFCIMELRWAKLYGCRIIGVMEKDSRHGAVDFGREMQLAPSDLQHILADVEFVEYQRREPYVGTMVDDLLHRAGVAPPPPPVSGGALEAPRAQEINSLAELAAAEGATVEDLLQLDEAELLGELERAHARLFARTPL